MTILCPTNKRRQASHLNKDLPYIVVNYLPETIKLLSKMDFKPDQQQQQLYFFRNSPFMDHKTYMIVTYPKRDLYDIVVNF